MSLLACLSVIVQFIAKLASLFTLCSMLLHLPTQRRVRRAQERRRLQCALILLAMPVRCCFEFRLALRSRKRFRSEFWVEREYFYQPGRLDLQMTSMTKSKCLSFTRCFLNVVDAFARLCVE
jgi:hypothetical protein